jgi:hypothetical protein
MRSYDPVQEILQVRAVLAEGLGLELVRELETGGIDVVHGGLEPVALSY